MVTGFASYRLYRIGNGEEEGPLLEQSGKSTLDGIAVPAGLGYSRVCIEYSILHAYVLRSRSLCTYQVIYKVQSESTPISQNRRRQKQ